MVTRRLGLLALVLTLGCVSQTGGAGGDQTADAAAADGATFGDSATNGSVADRSLADLSAADRLFADRATADSAADAAPVPDRDAAFFVDVAARADASSGLASSIHVALGIPTDQDPSDDILLDHQIYVVSYNPKRNDPNWVSWHLVAGDVGTAMRQDDYRADDLLPAAYYHVTTKDYTGSGYDRGHMCPSAERTASVAMNSVTFFMTNMLPQLHALNAGPWEGLETFERDQATSGHKEIYIVAGGLFDAAPPTIGPGIAVPRANFKIVVVLDAGQGATAVTARSTVYAVIMPNTAATTGTKWGQYAVSVDEIERQSGYDFLSALPTDVQDGLESRVASAPP